MAKQNDFNLKKEAHLFSGKERACFVIRNNLEKVFGKQKKGFLSEQEERSLLQMPDKSTSREYRAYWNLYNKVDYVMAVTTETYMHFKFHYERLTKAHTLLNLSAGLELIGEFIEGSIIDRIKTQGETRDKDGDYYLIIEEGKNGKPEEIADDLRKQLTAVLAFFNTVNPIDTKEQFTLKQSVLYIREAVIHVYNYACFFMSMRAVIDKMNEDFGFDIFFGRAYSETLIEYQNEMQEYIDEHNKLIRGVIKDYSSRLEGKPEKAFFNDVDAYLIKAPTHKTTFYDKQISMIYGHLYD